MAQAKFPLINGFKYSFSSIEVDIGGEIFTDIQALDYSDTVSRAKLRGANAVPLGITRGDYEAVMSFTLSKRGAKDFRALLGPGFKEKFFDVTTTYTEKEEGTTTDKVIGCLIIGNENSHSPGPDALIEVIPCDVHHIIWDGLDPMLNMLK